MWLAQCAFLASSDCSAAKDGRIKQAPSVSVARLPCGRTAACLHCRAKLFCRWQARPAGLRLSHGSKGFSFTHQLVLVDEPQVPANARVGGQSWAALAVDTADRRAIARNTLDPRLRLQLCSRRVPTVSPGPHLRLMSSTPSTIMSMRAASASLPPSSPYLRLRGVGCKRSCVCCCRR